MSVPRQRTIRIDSYQAEPCLRPDAEDTIGEPTVGGVVGHGARVRYAGVQYSEESTLQRRPATVVGMASSNGSADLPEPIIRVGILVVHGHALLGDALGMALNLDPRLDVVDIQSDPNVGLRRIPSAAPDVIVVDSLTLVAQLKRKLVGAKYIALGPSNDPGFVLACIRVGIDGCIGMSISPTEVGDSIKRVHEGDAIYESRALMELLQRPHLGVAAQPQRTATLAKREVDVLSAIGRGMTSFEAADHLGISISTLRTHVKNILVKLNARSKLDAVLIAIREGRIDLLDE